MSDQSVLVSNELPSDAATQLAAIEFRLADLHTMMPGQVISYDPAKNTCAVQPLLKRVYVELDGSETAESAPLLPEVPIWFPRGGGFRMAWPLNPGDIVMLGFVERSIDQWAHTGGEVVPRPARRHDWWDAIAFPGCSPASSAIQQLDLTSVVLGSEDGAVGLRLDLAEKKLTVTGATIEIGADAISPAVLGDALNKYLTETLSVSTPFGPSGPAIAPLLPGKELSETVKVK